MRLDKSKERGGFMSSSQLDFASMDSISTDLCDNGPEVLGKKKQKKTSDRDFNNQSMPGISH